MVWDNGKSWFFASFLKRQRIKTNWRKIHVYDRGVGFSKILIAAAIRIAAAVKISEKSTPDFNLSINTFFRLWLTL